MTGPYSNPNQPQWGQGPASSPFGPPGQPPPPRMEPPRMQPPQWPSQPPIGQSNPQVPAWPSQPQAPAWPAPHQAPAPAWPVQPAGRQSGLAQLSSGRPITTLIASIALALAALITLIQAIRVSMGVDWLGDSVNGFTDDVNSTNTVNLATEQVVDEVTDWLLIANYSMAAIAIAMYILFAVSIWRGHKWPRIAAIPLCIISLGALIGFDPGAVFIVVLGIGATIAAWLPPSIAYTNGQPYQGGPVRVAQ